MPNSKPGSASPTEASHTKTSTRSSRPLFAILFSALAPVLAAILVYQLDSFDPAPLPLHELANQPRFAALTRNDRMLEGSEFVGTDHLIGPEDIAYDGKSGVIYTGCADGWIKRVTVNNSVVEKLVNTGGRPLGLVLGHNNDLIVADAFKGLLRVSADGGVEALTEEADGVKLKLTDGVDISDDGTIYFTDASYKHDLHSFIWDVLEGKPHGRLISFDPITQNTKVLLHGLYFPNGVAVSPDQDFLVFCETTMRRCRKYYIQGKKKGLTEKFVDNLPGAPDNIRYDGLGHYWIAISGEVTAFWDVAFKYPFIRKVMGILIKYKGGPFIKAKNGGVFMVDLEGKPNAHYHDPRLSMISSGFKIGDHLYCGSFHYPYFIRLNLAKHPATATTTT